MMGRIRRWRLLTLALLLATPGLGGTALQSLHPCPETTPWAAAHADATPSASHAAHADHGAHGAGEDAAPGHADACHCVGACISAAAVLTASAGLPSFVAAGYRPPRPAVAPELPASRPLDRLPPATAPPLV